MNTIISTYLFNAEEDFTKTIQNNPNYSKYVSFNPTTGLAKTNILNKKTIKWIWETLKKQFPLSCIISADSVYEERLISFYKKLSDTNKAYIDIEKAEVGSRISVFISQDREDLQDLFWQTLFPSDDTDTKKSAMRCRSRDYIDDVHGIVLEKPEEERIAVRLGVWDEMQYRDGKLIVTSNLYSLIEEEKRRRDCGKSKKRIITTADRIIS